MDDDMEMDFFSSNSDEKKRVQQQNIKSVIKQRTTASAPTVEQGGEQSIIHIPVSSLKDNPYQPRLEYDKEQLTELALSIKEHGFLQPISVFKTDDGYVIRFGHRRVRACRSLGLKTIPAILSAEVSDQQLRSISLVENLQREQMHIIDISLSLRSAMDSGDFKSIAELARTIGRDRTYVSKVLSILTLPQAVIDDLIKKKSTNDRTVLDQLRSIKDEKKCAEIYFWYIQSKGDRFGLKQKIKEALEVEEGVEKMYEIKETYKGLTVKLPKLNKKQLDKLEHFFEELLQNK